MKHLATGLPSDPRRDLGFTPTAIRFGLLGASVFFLGTLAIYLIARTGQIDAHVTSAQGLERIRMPIWFWFSTLMILVSSVSLWGTKKFVENRDPRLARRAVVAAAALGWAFLLLQVPGIRALFREHALMADQRV
ncbi:MAG: hypothetical protein KC729_11635, partial [Candidatus Eisenbacteria bacterium]|nr:hypothetical protein [Candidatus Eisenbacteria bacterium]